MAREFAGNFYTNARWRRARTAYIRHRQSIDGGLCERCKIRPGIVVHHKTELSPETITDNDICYGFGNLKLVCQDCHAAEHEHRREPIEGMTKIFFDADGQPHAVEGPL